jgi:hypothetical protein
MELGRGSRISQSMTVSDILNAVFKAHVGKGGGRHGALTLPIADGIRSAALRCSIKKST